jgi:RNA polymerase sigma-70 factor (ECF subfamily)
MTTTNFLQQVAGLEAPLRAFANRLTNNTEATQQLYKTTVEKALAKQHRYQEDRNLKKWLFTLMRNVHADNYRRSVKPAPFSATPPEQEKQIGHRAPQSINYAIWMNDMQLLVDGLDHERQTVFLLHYYGNSNQEIAERLSLPLSTISARITSARKELKSVCLQKR